MSNRYFWPSVYLDFSDALRLKKISLEGKIYSMSESDLRKFTFNAVEALIFYLSADGSAIIQDDGEKALEVLLKLSDIKSGK